jgi:hypothetical protein
VSDQQRRPTVVLAKTASATMQDTENGALVTNRGAAGTLVLKLKKASHRKGVGFRFLRIANHAVQIEPEEATDQLMDVDGTLLAAGNYQELGSNGASIEFVSDGTNWVNVAERGTINNE